MPGKVNGLRPVFLAVDGGVKVAASPVLDEVEAPALEVMLEEMPERDPGELSDMGCVVDDHVKLVGRVLGRDPIEQGAVLLFTAVDLDASQVVDGRGVDVKPDDPGVR